MRTSPTFDELVGEAASASVDGWDFSWLDGRATEERPSWGYSGLLGTAMAGAGAALDIQTGGGEVLATVPSPPPLLVATESWPPNVRIAAERLRPLGAAVVVAPPDSPSLPFRDGAFDLVTSRHPIRTPWSEIARVLRPGGRYLYQQVAAGSVSELVEAITGVWPDPGVERVPENAAAAASRAGLTVVDLRQEALRAVFYDIGAVVWFLRKVVWAVPDFTVDRYREPLLRLHELIEAEGSFRMYSRRFLIDARKPT